MLGTSIFYSVILKFTIFLTKRCQDCKLIHNLDNFVLFKVNTTNKTTLTILISNVVVVVK